MRKALVLALISFGLNCYGEQDRLGNVKVFGGSGLVDRSLNPAISVNALFLGSYGSAAESVGLNIQEVEGIFSASIDPYFFGMVVLTSEGGQSLGVEEAYASTLSVPHVTLKAGKFLGNFGKNNLLHTHAQPLVDRPLVNRILFGEEALNSVGVEADLLVPVSWYFDLIVAAINGKMAGPFNAYHDESVAGVARMEHLFDLSDETTLGIGTSYAIGENEEKRINHYVGADAVIKYVSTKGRGDFAIAWTNEFIYGRRNGIMTGDLGEKSWGVYSSVVVRIQRRFWIGSRFDFLKKVDLAPDFPRTTAENLLVAYVPSEFSAIRLQGGLTQTNAHADQWQVLLQLIISMGSHPAHAY